MARIALGAPSRDAAAWWDCLRLAGGVVSAHRGGPGEGRPENSLAAFKATTNQMPAVLETDVSISRDGVLFLHHDRTLERTTTGAGSVAATTWAAIARLRLKDAAGRATDERPTALATALAWARGRAVLFLDPKPPPGGPDPAQDYRDFAGALVGAVRAAGAERSVVVIAYTQEQALTLHALAPDLMLSVGVSRVEDLDQLAARGLDLARVIAWTGAGRPDPELWAALSARGVEVNFGTLGEPGTRLDDVYGADGDRSEYASLITKGVDVIASGAPIAAGAAISADETAAQQCRGR
jgi:glycerophosphoryl diester phosphodiesterase